MNPQVGEKVQENIKSKLAQGQEKTKTPKVPKPKESPIQEAPGENQVLITSETSITDIVAADKAGKNLVFSMLDFPEISMAHLGELSPQAQMAYQMDLRNSNVTSRRVADGGEPFHRRIKVLDAKDPLRRQDRSTLKGQAKKLPKGMKHLNVGPHEVAELEEAGWRKAKPEEVDIVGSKVKAGAVVLTDQRGNIDNVTMLVSEKDYEEHRKVERSISEARIEANVTETKEKLRQYAPKVHIYDKSELSQK